MALQRHGLIVATVAIAILTGVSPAPSDDPSPAEVKPFGVGNSSFVAFQKEKAEKKAKKARKFRGRLPAYYRKAGISNKQRSTIYQIQISYREKIQALEKQLRELKAKQRAEVEAVLTEDQKKKVDESRAAAKKKRDARRKKRSAK